MRDGRRRSWDLLGWCLRGSTMSSFLFQDISRSRDRGTWLENQDEKEGVFCEWDSSLAKRGSLPLCEVFNTCMSLSPEKLMYACTWWHWQNTSSSLKHRYMINEREKQLYPGSDMFVHFCSSKEETTHLLILIPPFGPPLSFSPLAWLGLSTRSSETRGPLCKIVGVNRGA